MEIRHYDKDRNKQDSLEIKTSPEKTSKYLNVLKTVLGRAIIALVVLVMFIAAWVNFMQRPISSDRAEFDYFEIKKGATTMEIGQELQSKKIIRSKWAFYFAVKFNPGIIQAGHYKLSASMGVDEILSKMRKGEVDAFSLTIPEGYRTLQIAKILSKQEGIDTAKFIESATGKEGTLFPDTYIFPKSYDPSKIVKQMQDNFENRTKDLDVDDDQLIIASIVEREAIADDERPKIAAVYLNRMNKGMLLQADPTIRYGLDSLEYIRTKSVDFEFWKPITKDDISSLSTGFNTYKQKGLPPAPICNPGLKSIEATLKPAADFSDYFYFFHDKDQKIHFSKTYQEHLESLSKYN